MTTYKPTKQHCHSRSWFLAVGPTTVQPWPNYKQFSLKQEPWGNHFCSDDRNSATLAANEIENFLTVRNSKLVKRMIKCTNVRGNSAEI